MCLERVALMFVVKPLVLASSTGEARVGNHPLHIRGRDLQAHLIMGPCGHANQLPEIDGDLQLTPRLCVKMPRDRCVKVARWICFVFHALHSVVISVNSQTRVGI